MVTTSPVVFWKSASTGARSFNSEPASTLRVGLELEVVREVVHAPASASRQSSDANTRERGAQSGTPSGSFVQLLDPLDHGLQRLERRRVDHVDELRRLCGSARLQVAREGSRVAGAKAVLDG